MVVVEVAMGCAMVVELNPTAGLQEYVLPLIADVPITDEGTVHVSIISGPALTVGVGKFVIFAVAVLMHPFAAVDVTVYTVALDGVTVTGDPDRLPGCQLLKRHDGIILTR